jgi:endoglucanase
VAYYSIYQKNPISKQIKWLGVTSELSFTVRSTRFSDEGAAVFEIVAVDSHGVISRRVETSVPLPDRPKIGEALRGTVIGTTGSFKDSGHTRERVFDGDAGTYFDAPTGSDAWVGIDLGAAGSSRVSGIRVIPREGWAVRMIGGVFEGANQEDFSDAVTLASIEFEPAEGMSTLFAANPGGPFRYLRYRSPANGSCNVSEVVFHSPASPKAPGEKAPSR